MNPVTSVDCPLGTSYDLNTQMSQDQVYHLTMGLALTYKFVTTTKTITYYDENNNSHTATVNLRNKARQIFKRIFDNMQNDNWVIKDPDGDPVTFDGNRSGNTFAYRASFPSLGEFFSLPNIYKDNKTNFLNSKIAWNSWQIPYYLMPTIYVDIDGTTVEIDILNESNWHMALVLAAITDSWKSFGNNVTSKKIYEISSFFNWDAFYPLLHSVLRDKPLYKRCKSI
jgi:hypothetical protein